MPEVAEGILVGHEVNAQLPAVRVELADFIAGQRAPALPDGWVMAIGECVLGIELKFVDFEIGEVPDQFEQCFELWHATARDVQHHAASRKIRPVANFQARQTAAVLAQQLSHRRHGNPQPGGFTEFNPYAFAINRDRVAFGMVGRGVALDDGERWERMLLCQRERARAKLQRAGAGE